MNRGRGRLAEGSVIVALLGLVFVSGGVGFWYVELVPRAETLRVVLFDLIMHVLFGGVILVLGVHIERSELQPNERFAVMVWCYGGFTLMFSLSAFGHLDSILDGVLTLQFVSDFFVFSSLGGAFGVIAGVNWGRAVRNKALAEQNEAQSETLALLTRILSHDIRNDMTIMLTHVELLREHVDEDGRSNIEVIFDRIEEIVELLKDASALVKSLDEERELETVDLAQILTDEVSTLQTNHADVEVTTDIPDEIPIKADRLINQLFSNLLQNAVFHNDVETLRIDVTAERLSDNVEVTISDNGKGVPPEMREKIFELGEQGPESAGDGIGLYLVSRLADVYGGSVQVDASPKGGARFRIVLPTVETAEGA